MTMTAKSLSKPFLHQGRLLRRVRKAKGFTQKELASILGWDTLQFVSNIERGLSGIPPERVHRISKYLLLKELKAAHLKDVETQWVFEMKKNRK
jgi:transcriptional regulator with XRE-family HTH domain